MNNPAPRPALRKAEDAKIHPAAPRPARSARAVRVPAPVVETPVPAAEPATKPKARKTESGPRKRKFSGSTSDHMRVPDFTAEISDEAAARNGVEKKPRRPAHDTFFGAAPDELPAVEVALASVPPAAEPESEKPGTVGGQATAVGAARSDKRAKAPNLMSGKAVELDVHVPKELRKAAKAQAKGRGLDLDTVVVDLLLTWLSTTD